MKRSTRGFTLLEVMIAVVIMAFISLFTSRMIQQGVQAKKKVQGEFDRTSGIKSALALITQDIQVAFNYHDVNAELFNAAHCDLDVRGSSTHPNYCNRK
jgi:type II secretion system protein J